MKEDNNPIKQIISSKGNKNQIKIKGTLITSHHNKEIIK